MGGKHFEDKGCCNNTVSRLHHAWSHDTRKTLNYIDLCTFIKYNTCAHEIMRKNLREQKSLMRIDTLLSKYFTKLPSLRTGHDIHHPTRVSPPTSLLSSGISLFYTHKPHPWFTNPTLGSPHPPQVSHPLLSCHPKAITVE